MARPQRDAMVPRMYRELAKRSHDGIVVRLLWDAVRDRVIVTYRDERTSDAFAADVPRSEALQAFRHPNVYRPADLQAAA
jgi:hypothetical protein